MQGFGEILLYLVGGLVFLAGGLTTAWLVRPNRPDKEKLSTYECGEEPAGSAWGQFNIRFYVVALIFVLFDVEIVFLFPWATVFGSRELNAATQGSWGWFALAEMAIFIAVLALGLAWAWAKGLLNWVKPTAQLKTSRRIIPAEAYQHLLGKPATEATLLTKSAPEA